MVLPVLYSIVPTTGIVFSDEMFKVENQLIKSGFPRLVSLSQKRDLTFLFKSAFKITTDNNRGLIINKLY